MKKIAALLTCHNRKEKTLECLSSLYSITNEVDVYIVDDGSTDGTDIAILSKFTEINLIKGNGNLYWSRGMRLAWQQAALYDYDYYLWLNDDIKLYSFFLDELIDCCKWGEYKCIVSGLIEDAKNENIIYGGYDVNKNLIKSQNIPQEVKYMNGNVVLVPKSIVEKIGIIDSVFHHDLGDTDYGLSAQKVGIKVLSTRKPVAMGYSNNYCRVRKWNSTFMKRMQKLYSPLGSHPSINFYFRKKHFGIVNASCYWLYLHLINILSDKAVVLLWGDLYKDKA